MRGQSFHDQTNIYFYNNYSTMTQRQDNQINIVIIHVVSGFFPEQKGLSVEKGFGTLLLDVMGEG